MLLHLNENKNFYIIPKRNAYIDEIFMLPSNIGQTKRELLPVLMKDDRAAVYGNSLSQKSYDSYQKCSVIAVPRKYGLTQEGMVIPKNSSFKPAFTYFIRQFIENGYVNRIKQSYKSEDQVCPSYQGKPIGLRKCITSFGVLWIGVALSFLFFM